MKKHLAFPSIFVLPLGFVALLLVLVWPAALRAQMPAPGDPDHNPRFFMNAGSYCPPRLHAQGDSDVTVSGYPQATGSVQPAGRLMAGPDPSCAPTDRGISLPAKPAVPDSRKKADNVGASPESWYSPPPGWSLLGAPLIEQAAAQWAAFGNSLLLASAARAVHGPAKTGMIGAGASPDIQAGSPSFLIVPRGVVQDSTLRAAEQGSELSYKIDHQWETALTTGQRTFRFGLDKEGTTSNAIDQTDSWPVFVRLSRKLGANLRLDVYGGMAIGGMLRPEDGTRQELDRPSSPANVAPLTGFSLSTTF